MRALTFEQKLKQVYAEFRSIFGASRSAGELYRLAARFVREIERAQIVEADFLHQEKQVNIGISVDVALRDGGWTIMSREKNWYGSGDDEEIFIPKCIRMRAYPELERSLFPTIGEFVNARKKSEENQ